MKIICLDFDGVIHSYTSGWQGPRAILDNPVPGALEFIVKAQESFIVAIYSSRSHALFGRLTMKNWLKIQYTQLGSNGYESTPDWLKEKVSALAFANPWDEEVSNFAATVIRKIQFPLHKPPAFITIDDRAIQFTGTFPDVEEIKKFRPWNKQ